MHQFLWFADLFDAEDGDWNWLDYNIGDYRGLCSVTVIYMWSPQGAVDGLYVQGLVSYVIHPLLRGAATPGEADLGTSLFHACDIFFLILSSLLLFYLSAYLSYFILAVPMRKYWEQHSCMSSRFSIATLN